MMVQQQLVHLQVQAVVVVAAPITVAVVAAAGVAEGATAIQIGPCPSHRMPKSLRASGAGGPGGTCAGLASLKKAVLPSIFLNFFLINSLKNL